MERGLLSPDLTGRHRLRARAVIAHHRPRRVPLSTCVSATCSSAQEVGASMNDNYPRQARPQQGRTYATCSPLVYTAPYLWESLRDQTPKNTSAATRCLEELVLSATNGPPSWIGHGQPESSPKKKSPQKERPPAGIKRRRSQGTLEWTRSHATRAQASDSMGCEKRLGSCTDHAAAYGALCLCSSPRHEVQIASVAWEAPNEGNFAHESM